MKTVIVTLALVLSTAANAAALPKSYIVGGKSVDAATALTAALKGQNVLQCVQVEAKPNKAGTSIGMKARKAK